uniref:Uncharacterized protein n=1 Tax=Setaria digitata TaxID=48799 RepID=A0A915Q3A3_9BILA
MSDDGSDSRGNAPEVSAVSSLSCCTPPGLLGSPADFCRVASIYRPVSRARACMFHCGTSQAAFSPSTDFTCHDQQSCETEPESVVIRTFTVHPVYAISRVA